MSMHIIHFTQLITEEGSTRLMGAVIDALRNGASKLQVKMASTGGSTTAGFTLCNFFKTLPVPVSIHNLNRIESVAVPIYLSVPVRTCSPESRFVVHPLTWNFATVNNVPHNTLRESLLMLDDDADHYIRVFEEATKGAEKIFDVRKALAGEGATIIDATTAVTTGIAHRITSEPLPNNVPIWYVNA